MLSVTQPVLFGVLQPATSYHVGVFEMSDFLGTYTWAQLPAAASSTGYRARVTDAGPTGGVIMFSDGARWKAANGVVNLARLGAAVSGITNAETIVLQTLIPAGLWQTNDTLRVWVALTKSGTTDTLNITGRIGTAGTTADTAITGLTAVAVLPAANVAGGFIYDVKLASATSALRLGSPSATLGTYTAGAASAASAATTITDASANALYLSISIASSSTNNTVAIQSGQIQLVTP